jgi:hypothetical protein
MTNRPGRTPGLVLKGTTMYGTDAIYRLNKQAAELAEQNARHDAAAGVVNSAWYRESEARREALRAEIAAAEAKRVLDKDWYARKYRDSLRTPVAA